MSKPIDNTCIELFGSKGKAAIYVYKNNRGDCQVLDYISKLDQRSQKKIAALFLRFIKEGEIYNQEQFKYLVETNGLWEFKRKPHRIICFFIANSTPKNVVLIHAFKKEGQKTPKHILNKTESIKNTILKLHENNNLIRRE